MKSDKKHKILYKWKLFIVDYIESFFCEETMIIIDIMIQDFYNTHADGIVQNCEFEKKFT